MHHEKSSDVFIPVLQHVKLLWLARFRAQNYDSDNNGECNLIQRDLRLQPRIPFTAGLLINALSMHQMEYIQPFSKSIIL